MSNQNVDSQENNDAADTKQEVPNSQSGSINGADQMAKLLDAKLTEALKPVLAEVRGVQGRQDKDRTALKEFMDEYHKQKAKGLTDDAAADAAESSINERKAAQTDKELLRKIAEKVLGPSFAGNEPPVHADIVSSYGLDANDPEVVANVLSLKDPKDAEIAAARLMKRRQTQPSPSATAAGTIVTSPTKHAGVEELTIQYKKEVIAARGNRRLITELRDSFAKKGVDVHSVDFT